MQKQMTVTSAAEYDRVLYGHMTPEMVVSYLQGNQLPPRTFSGVLRQMYPGSDLQMRLVDFFVSLMPEGNAQSVVKKIKNWLTDKNLPANREELFRIAFALGFSEAQLDYLLSMCTDYGIQYRDGKDAVFAWFLRNGRSYQEAKTFFESLPAAPGMNLIQDANHSHLTRELQGEFLLVQTMKELRQCYLKNLHSFGSMHLRAYYYFDKFLSLLIHPAPSWIDVAEPYYSLETVMRTYLSLQMPSGKKRENYSLIQKLIKQNWPNATSLKNIRSQKEDVPRKLLLLLYIITEDTSVVQGQLAERLDGELTMQERIEEHWWTLNAMLGDCGMALLDPRNVNDWLILYAIGAAGEEASMSERLEQVIALMYENV